ncbi:unnamed protein product, partial [Phaeothamnion confervicola]
ITTPGAGSNAIVAQSVHGGGGLVMNGNSMVLKSGGGSGTDGLVTVTVNKAVAATGTGASGVVMHSSADPILNVGSSGSVLGGPGGVAALFDGPINVLNNSGTVSGATAGDLAVQSVSGDTTVNNSGTLFGNFTLAAGGTNLVNNMGTGRILAGSSLDLGGGVLQNDGVLQNGGGSVGTVTINGSLKQSATGSLVVRLDQVNGTVDAFNVTGTAELKGTLRPTTINGGQIAPGTISLTNVFSATGGLDISGLSIANTAIMNYTLTNVGGVLGFTSTANFSPRGLSAAGQQIASIISGAQANGLPHFTSLTVGLVGISTTSALDQAYRNVSGVGASSVTTVGSQMTTSFMTLMLNPFAGAPGNNAAAIGFARGFAAAGQPVQRWSIWGSAYGGYNETSGATSAEDLTARVYGLATGFDYRATPDTLIGFALGGGGTNSQLSNGFSERSDAFQFGVYGSKKFGESYLSGALSYAWHNVNTTRYLSLPNATYTAAFNAHSFGGRVEAGHRFETPMLGITPYAALQVQNFFTPSYSETAAAGSPPALALSYNSRSAVMTRTELGAVFDKMVALTDGRALAIRTRAAWAHDHSSNPDI